MKKTEQAEQTKLHLAAALKEEMNTKPFDAITISAILKRSDIARPTFYYHFQDIYALMEWMFEREAVDLLKRSEDCYTWDDGVLLMLRYVQENRKVCMCAVSGMRLDFMERLFYKDAASIMQRFVASFPPEIQPAPADAAFIQDFYIRAMVGSLVKWLEDDAKESPETMVERLDIAMHGAILAAMQRSQNKSKDKPSTGLW